PPTKSRKRSSAIGTRVLLFRTFSTESLLVKLSLIAGLGTETFQPLNVPVWEAVFASRPHDSIYVVVCGRPRNHRRADVAKSRSPLSVERFCKYRLGQVDFSENILGVGVQAVEFSMGSGSENAIDGMLLGANKVRTGSDANVEASEP